jgi:hypothetical protein
LQPSQAAAFLELDNYVDGEGGNAQPCHAPHVKVIAEATANGEAKQLASVKTQADTASRTSGPVNDN